MAKKIMLDILAGCLFDDAVKNELCSVGIVDEIHPARITYNDSEGTSFEIEVFAFYSDTCSYIKVLHYFMTRLDISGFEYEIPQEYVRFKDGRFSFILNIKT